MSVQRLLAATFAAFEALLVVVLGLAIAVIPLTIVWLTRLDLGLDWSVFYRVGADAWLLGHGVHFTLTLDPALASAVALPGADAPFLLSLAPLVFAIVTFTLAVRLGRRTVEADARFLGPVTAIVTFWVASTVVVLTSAHAAASPTLWRALSLPTVVFALGVVLGARGEIVRSWSNPEARIGAVTSWWQSVSPRIRAWLTASVVGALGSTGILLAFAAVATSVLLVSNFAAIIRLYESVQAGPGGGAVLTLGEMLFIPNIVAWVAAWLTGAGFALGRGSWVTPAGTDVGPLPSFPILGMIPEGGIPGGYIWVAIPIVAALISGRIVRRRVVVASGPHRGRWLLATSVGMSVAALFIGIILGAATSGSIGPARMSEWGPAPWSLGLYLGVEVLVGSLIGLLTRGRYDARE